MKKVFCVVLCMVLLLCTSAALASDRLEAYKQALNSKTWEMTSTTLVDTSKAAPNLTLVGAYYTSISLKNKEIQLFEDIDGKIYMTFSHKNIYGGKYNDFAIVEIIFNENMSAFMAL